MRKHAETILKYACLILAAVVLYQLIGMVRRVNPLRGVTVPPLPTLATDTNNSPSSPENGRAINPVSTTNTIKATNRVPVLAETNSVGTNAVLSASRTNNISTNSVANTNSAAPAGTGTNLASSSKTNSEHTVIVLLPTGTNAVVSAASTNNVSTNQVAHTNSAVLAANENKSNHPSGNEPSPRGRMPGPFGGGMGMGKPTTLPPVIQAQVTKIIDSEILGPVPHPLPMALMGIAGEMAFLRSPDGQTGVVKVGDSLGEIKLVRLGINRVLVEQGGQQKELTIFDGYGGESLLTNGSGMGVSPVSAISPSTTNVTAAAVGTNDVLKTNLKPTGGTPVPPPAATNIAIAVTGTNSLLDKQGGTNNETH